MEESSTKEKEQRRSTSPRKKKSAVKALTWGDLLKEAARGEEKRNSTLIVCGPVSSGRRSLLRALGFLHQTRNDDGKISTRPDNDDSDGSTAAEGFGYTFFRPEESQGGKRESDDKSSSGGDEELLYSHDLDVWWISEPSHMDWINASLKDKFKDVDGESGDLSSSMTDFTKNSALSRAVFVVCVDLARPYLAKECVETWTKAIEKLTQDMQRDLPAGVRDDLHKNVRRRFLAYAGGKGSKAMSEESGDDLSDLPKNALTHNLGISLLVVGTRSDSLIAKKSSGGSSSSSGHYALDSRQKAWLQWWLGSSCLKFGAALVCTSATAGFNCDLLRRYIYHCSVPSSETRPFEAAPYVLDFARLFVPIGAESSERLEALHLSTEASETSAFESVVPLPRNGNVKRDTASARLATTPWDDGAEQVSTLAFLEALKALSDAQEKQLKPKKRVVRVARSAGTSIADTASDGGSDSRSGKSSGSRHSNDSKTARDASADEGRERAKEGKKEPNPEQLNSFFQSLISTNTTKKDGKRKTRAGRKQRKAPTEGVATRTRGRRNGASRSGS
eukprot:g672.t1